MLTERFPKDFVARAIVGPEARDSFPPAADRAAWDGLLRHPLNQRRKDGLMARSEELLARGQQVLPVSGYAEFVRSGDRKGYESAYFSRRRDLAILVLSTCFSPDARSLEAALDIAWAICEETSWALPAHVDRRSPRDAMPEVRRPTLDIFSCETAAVLAETVHLLRAEFDGLSPVIAERIEGEIARRVIEPFENRDDFWWLSGENNWTPWCISGILLAAAHIIRDRSVRASTFGRTRHAREDTVRSSSARQTMERHVRKCGRGSDPGIFRRVTRDGHQANAPASASVIHLWVAARAAEA